MCGGVVCVCARLTCARCNSGEEVAVKLESVKTKHPQLLYESKLYRLLAGGIGIPNVRWFGVEGEFNILVMDLLGPSLEDLFNFCSRKFRCAALPGNRKAESVQGGEQCKQAEGRAERRTQIVEANSSKGEKEGRHAASHDAYNAPGTFSTASLGVQHQNGPDAGRPAHCSD